jgi:hypothetical protein
VNKRAVGFYISLATLVCKMLEVLMLQGVYEFNIVENDFFSTISVEKF